MPSQPKNRQEAKSTYVRLTIGQKIEIKNCWVHSGIVPRPTSTMA
ncbi:hypothetical protein F442_17593, partial [Phytophthora nicotianae P10297]